MVGYGPGWAEKVRNLSYAFRGPTWVRLETQEDVMEEEQAGEAAEACMHGALIHLGCVELERRVIKNRAQTTKVELLTRPSSNKPDGQIHSVPSKSYHRWQSLKR